MRTDADTEATQLLRRVREAVAFHAGDLGLELTAAQRVQVEAEALLVLRQGPVPLPLSR